MLGGFGRIPGAIVGGLAIGVLDLTRVKARDMVRHGIGYVPEGRPVFPGCRCGSG